MGYSVYVLYSTNINRYYTGYTDNFERRLSEHNDLTFGKGSKYTLRNGPWKLAYKEDGFETRSDAMKREKFLKSGVGRKFIKSELKK